uniref:Uncharacterized protein n=1 Tax=Arion vulgaris TaxID=1028688 RepID=A0A0B6ZYA5_9EUPU
MWMLSALHYSVPVLDMQFRIVEIRYTTSQNGPWYHHQNFHYLDSRGKMIIQGQLDEKPLKLKLKPPNS